MHLFGPILQYDLITTARRARYFAMRFFYALLLFLILYIFYVTRLDSVMTEKVARQKLIDFAELFSYIYLVVQYLLVLLLTPAYVGTAIAEEKERRTLEFLMATDLRNHEIILGKCASRLGNLLMFLLAGLPVLAFVLFFGGIDPELLKNGFLATFVTAFSVTCVSIYCSTHARHSREGIMRSYLVVLGYFIFGFILCWLVFFLKGTFWGLGMTGTWNLNDADVVTKTLCYFTEFYLTGDAFHAAFINYSSSMAPFLGTTSWTGVDLGTSLSDLLRNYVIFHVVVALLCLTVSIWRLRKLFALHAFGEKTHRSKKLTEQPGKKIDTLANNQVSADSKVNPRPGRRVAIDSWPPMVWKELLLPQLSRRTWRSRLIKSIAWAAFLLPLVIVFFVHYNHGYFAWNELKVSTNIYCRIAGTTCLCLMILGVGIRAANIVCMERDKQTMETLLSTVLTDHDILFGKWAGCTFSMGSSLFLILIIWITCFITGGISFLSILFLALAYLIYAAFAAALGIFFSSGAKTTTRSLLATLFWLIIWLGAHWLFIGMVLMFTASSETGEIIKFLYGMTPPMVLSLMSNPSFSGLSSDSLVSLEYAHYFWVGLVINALLTVTFYFLATHRFYLQTGRIHTLSR